MEKITIDFIENRPDLYQTAILAGGCFWCIEAAFENLEGVIDVVSGYTGGVSLDRPTYSEVSSGTTGHYEAVKITFNPLEISFLNILEVFFTQIDPTDPDGQFADRGSQYRTAIFYNNEEQKSIALNIIKILNDSGIYDKPIVTKVIKETVFFLAEDYHQDYAKLNTEQYELYAKASGRKTYITSLWKGVENLGEIIKGSKYSRPPEKELKRILTPLQYEVTLGSGTEPPFNNEYFNNHKQGIYVDIISGEPLFSSEDKFESGTGWPSFIKSIASENIKYEIDDSLSRRRVEVHSKYGKSHLGHVFNDGIGDTGLRYCMNSSALRFIPKEDMIKEGYAQYTYIFE